MAKSTYRFHRFTVPASSIFSLTVTGRGVNVFENSLTTSPLVSVDGDSEEEVLAGTGFELPPDEVPFSELKFRNTSASPMALLIGVTKGTIKDNRFAVTSVIRVKTVATTVESPAALTVPTTAPGAPTIAAASTVYEVVVQNNGANPIWYGDINVDPATKRGHKIEAGGTRILAINGDLYFRAETGSSTLSVVKHKEA